jgi:hypothetical protein
MIFWYIYQFYFRPEIFSPFAASLALKNNWTAEDTALIGGLILSLPPVILFLFTIYIFKKLFLSNNVEQNDSRSHDTEMEADQSIEKDIEGITYEKQFYSTAGNEINNGNIDDGIWSMAFSQSMGNEEEAQAIYITLRAKELKELSDLEEKTKEEILKNNNVRRAKSRHNWIIFFTLLLFIIFVAFILL